MLALEGTPGTNPQPRWQTPSPNSNYLCEVLCSESLLCSVTVLRDGGQPSGQCECAVVEISSSTALLGVAQSAPESGV